VNHSPGSCRKPLFQGLIDQRQIRRRDNIDYNQAIAMIDKYYKDHPERWARDFGRELLNALTIVGGPCVGEESVSTLTE
jgi:hypothetical protein